MSIRVKVFLIITAIILVITVSSVVISINRAQDEIITTLKIGMQSVASVANEYISGELDLLIMDASAVVQALVGVRTEDLDEILREQVAAYQRNEIGKVETFLAITVFNAAGRVDASYGKAPTPENMALGEYGKLAFEGWSTISSTRQDPSGILAFDLFVPMEEAFGARAGSRIVAFTVPGIYFTEKVTQFQIGGGGGKIAIGDREGTIIASRNQNWVVERRNFLDLIKKNRNYESAAKVIQAMTSGEIGAARFFYDGNDAATAYMPLTPPRRASDPGWFIAVTTPIADSAYNTVRIWLLISGLIFLGLGMLAAAFASGAVAKPFFLLEEQKVAKTNFLANMSFDLRTPLNAIVGLSELSLTKKDVPQDVRSYLERIYGSGETVMEVVNDLLDLSNMESGKFNMMPAEYDLPNFINDTVNANTMHIGSKPIIFHIIPDDNLPSRLVGDTLRIRQVFNNLLSNAFRHTSTGNVEWHISAEKDGNSVWLVSSVVDTGVGIKPENLDKLFIDYNRVDTDRMRHRDGASGMGLTLTKKILDLMDGNITVESVVGKGSTFTVRMRQKYVNTEVISPEFLDTLKNFKYVEQKTVDKADMQRIQLPGKRVLVVDDVEINFEIAQGMIEPYGVAVDCLANGQEAVELIRLGDPHYDMIFMSRWMTQMDGKEAVRIIRNEIGSEYAKSVPIIALTTNTVIGNKDIFLKWGFQDVLSKPLDVRHLDGVINTWLAKK